MWTPAGSIRQRGATRGGCGCRWASIPTRDDVGTRPGPWMAPAGPQPPRWARLELTASRPRWRHERPGSKTPSRIEELGIGLAHADALDVDHGLTGRGNGGDHPVTSDAAHDAEHPVVADCDVLAGDDRQQLHSVTRRSRERRRRPHPSCRRTSVAAVTRSKAASSARADTTTLRRSRSDGRSPPRRIRSVCGASACMPGDSECGTSRTTARMSSRRASRPVMAVPCAARFAGLRQGAVLEDDGCSGSFLTRSKERALW